MKSPITPVDKSQTVAPMDVPGMPWHRTRRKPRVPEDQDLTRAERRAMIKGALLALLLPLAAIGAAFLGVLLVLDLVWLR